MVQKINQYGKRNQYGGEEQKKLIKQQLTSILNKLQDSTNNKPKYDTASYSDFISEKSPQYMPMPIPMSMPMPMPKTGKKQSPSHFSTTSPFDQTLPIPKTKQMATGKKQNPSHFSTTSPFDQTSEISETPQTEFSTTSPMNYGQSGGQLDNNSLKKKTHTEVSDFINNEISKFENNSESETSVFLQNINDKLSGIGQNGQGVNSDVSTEKFLNYIEDKLNNNLNGGDINNILKDSFIEGMNKGGYLENDTITQQDIINRIRMSGGAYDESESSDSDESVNDQDGGKHDDDNDQNGGKHDDDDDDDDDDSSDSDSSESSSDSDDTKTSKKNKRMKKTDDEDTDTETESDSDSDDKESDSDDEEDEDDDEDDESDKELFISDGKASKKNKKSHKIDGGSLSSLIVTSNDNSVTPYMMSSDTHSLKTDDIDLISFSPHQNLKKNKKPKKSKK